MKHQQEQLQQSKTITNPRLFNINTKFNENSFDQSQRFSSPNRGQSIKFMSNIKISSNVQKNNLFDINLHRSPQIQKQSSFKYQNQTNEQFKGDKEKYFQNKMLLNAQTSQKITNFVKIKEEYLKQKKNARQQQNKAKINSLKTTNDQNNLKLNLQSNLFTKKESFNKQQNQISDIYSDTEDYILPGTDLNKVDIVLTIKQKIIQDYMELQNLAKNIQKQNQKITQKKDPLKLEYNIQMTQNIEQQEDVQQKANLSALKQPLIVQNFKQIILSLKDLNQMRQLKKLTPISSLKKYILNQFGYSSGYKNIDKFQLSFYNLHENQQIQLVYPITNEQNLQIILSEYIKSRKNIFILFQHNSKLKRKAQRKNINQFQAQFDSEGEIAEDQNQEQDDQIQGENQQSELKLIKASLRVNNTQMDKYKGINMVRCAFCQKSNKDIDSIKKCGPFYGPFLRNKGKTKHYCHLLCAIWCKKVYLNDDLKLQDISKQITRSQKKQCKYCHKFGAGLLCDGNRCGASMHYQCGLEKCRYNWQKYTLQCHDCYEKDQRKMEIQSNDQEKKQQNEKMQIQVDDFQNNHSFNQSHQIIQEPNQALKIVQFQNISYLDAENQAPQSRTRSNARKNVIITEPDYLGLDQGSRIQINSQSVQILQDRCKPAKNKINSSEVKLQECMQQNSNKQKSQRSARNKPKRK